VNDAAHAASARQRPATRPSPAEAARHRPQARLGLPDTRSALPRQGTRRRRRSQGDKPGHRPRLARGTTVRLRDGSAVLIRPMRQLSDRALRAGIDRFTALASADNAAVAALLRTIGAEPVRQEAGTVEYQITLTQRPDPNGRPATGLGKEAR